MISLVERFMTTRINAIDTEQNIAEAAKEMAATRRIGCLLVTREGAYVGIVTEADIVRKVIAKQLDPSGILVWQVMQFPLITIEADRTVMEANDLMESNTIRSDQTIGEALVLMFEHDIRHLPVLSHGKVVGMLSDRDIRQFLGKASIAAQHREEERRQLRLPVTEIMATHLYTVAKTTPLAEGIRLMVEHKIGAVPVVDSKEHIVGIFSEVDALRHCLYLIERYQGIKHKTHEA